jgi:hypothetical protein
MWDQPIPLHPGIHKITQNSKELPSEFQTSYLQQWHTQEFVSRGVQQIQLRTEGRENGDLGAVVP